MIGPHMRTKFTGAVFELESTNKACSISCSVMGVSHSCAHGQLNSINNGSNEVLVLGFESPSTGHIPPV